VAAADVRPELDAATSLRSVSARSMSIISHMDLIRCARCHRVVVIDASLIAFLVGADAPVPTPSFLHAHVEELGALADASVASLGLAAPDMFVFYVPARLSALCTLVEMDEHSLSAAGVVDESGELVANLSVSDLRDVPPDKLGLLVCAVASPGRRACC
jgi:hypothetical protein